MHRLVTLLLCWLNAMLMTQAAAMERFTAHGGPVKGLALSPDGRWMVSTSFDYSAVLWSTDGLKEVRRLIGHEAAVNTAAFSPDGQFLATAGDDSTIRVWRIADILQSETDIPVQLLKGHQAKIVHLAFSPDGKALASSSWDHSIGLWSFPDLTNLAFLRAHDSPVNAAVFSGDNRHLYSAGADGHVRLWDLETGRYQRSIVENGWGINVLAIDEQRGQLAYGTSNGALRTQSLTKGRAGFELLQEGPPVLSLYIDPASGRLVSGTSEGRVVIARLGDGVVEHDFHAAKGPVWSALVMPEARAIVFAGLDDFVTRLPLSTEMSGVFRDSDAERRFHPTGKLDNGERQFARKCSICHTLGQDDRRRAGPSLWKIFGRKAGSAEGYPYSSALAGADLVWSAETIDALFREGPDVVTPGSKMPLQRISNQQSRADLIRFLKENTGPY